MYPLEDSAKCFRFRMSCRQRLATSAWKQLICISFAVCIVSVVTLLVQSSFLDILSTSQVGPFPSQNQGYASVNRSAMYENASALEQCLEMSPFHFQPLHRDLKFDWTIQSNVQSVRLDGPSGLPMRCDWVIGTRMAHWRRIPIQTVYGNTSMLPRTVFVMVGHLQNFNDDILPCIPSAVRMVLIVGDGDLTTPRQLDKRYNFQQPETIFYNDGPTKHNFRYSTWQKWMNDSRILHIFVEHLDERTHAKISPIPTGLNPIEYSSTSFMHSTVEQLQRIQTSPIESRPLQIRFTNRVRDGPQWESRKFTREACDTKWKDYCVSGKAPDGNDFFVEISKFPFVICVHVGGLDPNPMAWSALLAGSIPIIERFPGDDIYDDLPVVMVERLPSATITLQNLSKWRNSLAPMFYGQPRKKVLEKLMTDFWWNRILEKLDGSTNTSM